MDGLHHENRGPDARIQQQRRFRGGKDRHALAPHSFEPPGDSHDPKAVGIRLQDGADRTGRANETAELSQISIKGNEVDFNDAGVTHRNPCLNKNRGFH